MFDEQVALGFSDLRVHLNAVDDLALEIDLQLLQDGSLEQPQSVQGEFDRLQEALVGVDLSSSKPKE